METKRVGEVVIFVDQDGGEHPALIQRVNTMNAGPPLLQLAYVDEAVRDEQMGGAAICRVSGVIHESEVNTEGACFWHDDARLARAEGERETATTVIVKVREILASNALPDSRVIAALHVIDTLPWEPRAALAGGKDKRESAR